MVSKKYLAVSETPYDGKAYTPKKLKESSNLKYVIFSMEEF